MPQVCQTKNLEIFSGGVVFALDNPFAGEICYKERDMHLIGDRNYHIQKDEAPASEKQV